MKTLILSFCLLAFLPSCYEGANNKYQWQRIRQRTLQVQTEIVRDSIALEKARDSLIILREKRIARDKLKYGDTPWK